MNAMDPFDQNRLLLDRIRTEERVPPEIDGLSGHANGFIATGLTPGSFKDLFVLPFESIPFIDLENVEVRRSRGYLQQLIMGDLGDLTKAINDIETQYGIKRFRLKGILKGITKTVGVIKDISYTEKGFTVTEHCMYIRNMCKEFMGRLKLVKEAIGDSTYDAEFAF